MSLPLTFLGTNMHFKDMYVNATATNAPFGANWVQVSTVHIQ